MGVDSLFLVVAEHYGVTPNAIRFGIGKDGPAAVKAARQALAVWLCSQGWPVASVAALLGVAHVHVRRMRRDRAPVPHAAADWPLPAPGARAREARSRARGPVRGEAKAPPFDAIDAAASRVARRTGLLFREVREAMREGRPESDF